MPSEQSTNTVGRRPIIRVVLVSMAVLLTGLAVLRGVTIARQHSAQTVTLPPDGVIPGVGPMPGWLMDADPSIQKEFVWAALHKQELQHVPCYCGCMAQGHTSNADCYYDFDSAGNFTGYDSHAFGCGVCLDITRAVRQGLAKGESLTRIRQEIDAKYQAQGMAPTPTPMPPANQ